MANLATGTKRDDERNDFAIRGPFGGIQSEAPSDSLDMFGFLDSTNILFRRGQAVTRPVTTAQAQLPASTGQVIVGVADFYNANGIRIQVLMDTVRLYQWTGGVWVQVTNPGSTGTYLQLFTWTVVGNKLFFCNGVDKITTWDGIAAAATFVANSVPSRYLCELAFHAMAGYTIEAGPQAAIQRVRWSRVGDGTDWATDFTSGQQDLFNDLGPITGMCKLYQQGYAFQQWGITQIIPTGIGLAPFQFIPMASKAKGNIAPYSLATFGEEISCYVGKNNIYLFNGVESIPIGDSPIDGSRYRTGARSRIFSDLQQSNLSTVFGYISTSINGITYSSYWLFIPELQVAWVYHFDEHNWTRFTFGFRPSIAGDYAFAQIPTIGQLVGPINAQLWSPSSLIAAPLDIMFLGQSAAGGTLGVPGYIDFSGVSEQPWNILSGECYFGDYRHKKSVSAIRLVLQDNFAGLSFNLTLTGNKGPAQTRPVGPIGTGSGSSLVVIVPFQPIVSGQWLKYTIFGAAGQRITLNEITPIPDEGGDIRAGGID